MIETSPAIVPFSAANRSMRPSSERETSMAVMTPAAAARFVLTSTMLMDTASTALARASWDPPLKPNQPNHRMKTPSVTTTVFEGGVGLALPSRPNLPSLGPTTSIPASAAHPPVLCTMVEPAKSWKPSSASHPPPHVHAPTMG